MVSFHFRPSPRGWLRVTDETQGECRTYSKTSSAAREPQKLGFFCDYRSGDLETDDVGLSRVPRGSKAASGTVRIYLKVAVSAPSKEKHAI
jgi:hypothetical protein